MRGNVTRLEVESTAVVEEQEAAAEGTRREERRRELNEVGTQHWRSWVFEEVAEESVVMRTVGGVTPLVPSRLGWTEGGAGWEK